MRVPVVSSWGSWRFRHSKSFQRFRDDLASVLSLLKLWRKSMHQIGGIKKNCLFDFFWELFCDFLFLFLKTGHFGGGVQSYFLFLRFLVILNFLSFLLMAGFVIIPSIVFHSSNSSGQSLVPSVNLSGIYLFILISIMSALFGFNTFDLLQKVISPIASPVLCF